MKHTMKTADDYFDAANLAESHGRCAEANAHYEKVLQLRPDYPEVYDNRAGNWVELAEYAKAIADYEKVIAYWPDYPGAHDSLAQIYLYAEDSSFHDNRLAADHARRACELCQFLEFGPVSTLASAHATNGKYADAIRMQERAIELASAELESELWIPKLNEQLTEYRHKHAEQHKGQKWFAWWFRRSSNGN